MSTDRVQNDNIWTKYLSKADKEDERLVDNWNKLLDVVLTFTGLFLSVLTAFIIQIANNFEPNPAEVTNKILITIYNHTMNASTPIDLEQFLSLDDNSRRANKLQNWLLYISLVLSLMLAVLAMAAKVWVARYNREVMTSGHPRDRSKKRQEILDGALDEWALGKGIEAIPVVAIIAVILFGFFVYSFLAQQQKTIAMVVSTLFHVVMAILLVASSTTTCISNSPFRSLYSDLHNFMFHLIFRISPDDDERERDWRTILLVVLISASLLVVGGYWLPKENYVYFLSVYLPVSFIGPLMWKGTEDRDVEPRLIGLPLLILIFFIAICTSFLLSVAFSHYSTFWCLLFYVLASILLGLVSYIAIKMSKKKPKKVEAKAISWVLQKSFESDHNPTWFKEVDQIAEEGPPYVRALLLKELLPLLETLIVSEPPPGVGNMKRTSETSLIVSEPPPAVGIMKRTSGASIIVSAAVGNMKSTSGASLIVSEPPPAVDDMKTYYINTLANLLDFELQEKSYRHNRAALERPDLPKGLLKKLREIAGVDLETRKCSHMPVGGDKEVAQSGNGEGPPRWPDGKERCPEKCKVDAAKYILAVYHDEPLVDLSRSESQNPEARLVAILSQCANCATSSYSSCLPPLSDAALSWDQRKFCSLSRRDNLCHCVARVVLTTFSFAVTVSYTMAAFAGYSISRLKILS